MATWLTTQTDSQKNQTHSVSASPHRSRSLQAESYLPLAWPFTESIPARQILSPAIQTSTCLQTSWSCIFVSLAAGFSHYRASAAPTKILHRAFSSSLSPGCTAYGLTIVTSFLDALPPACALRHNIGHFHSLHRLPFLLPGRHSLDLGLHHLLLIPGTSQPVPSASCSVLRRTNTSPERRT